MGEEKRIKDLATASSITNNDYLAMDNANNSAAKKTSAMPLRNVNAIANIQNNLVANKAYTIGEPFVYQGNVYQATAAIASGATITINGNCALADSLADQITALNNDLSNKISGHIFTKNIDGHISASWGNLYAVGSQVDISSLGLTSRPKKVSVSFLPDSGSLSCFPIMTGSTTKDAIAVSLVSPVVSNVVGTLTAIVYE